MRHTLILVRINIIKKSSSTTCWKGSGEKGTFEHSLRNGNFCGHDRNWYGGSLKNPKVELPYNSAFLFQGIYPGKKTTTTTTKTLIKKDTCILMFIT